MFQVGIIMGSISDWEKSLTKTASTLEELQI